MLRDLLGAAGEVLGDASLLRVYLVCKECAGRGHVRVSEAADNAKYVLLFKAMKYYSDVEFASQLCSEVAAAESRDSELSLPLTEAHCTLQLIVTHNAHLKSILCQHQPAWPRHEALMRFDLPLQCLESGLSATNESKEWVNRFYLLRGSRLYYCDGKNGHPDTQDGTLAFMRSKPAPDGRYCVDLQGMLTRARTCRDTV
jgi:hypothetical protein